MFMQCRRYRQRSIGDAARYHNGCTLSQRFDDWTRSQLSVGTADAVSNLTKHFAGIEVRERVAGHEDFVQAGMEVVARHNGEPTVREARLLKDGLCLGRTCQRIQSA